MNLDSYFEMMQTGFHTTLGLVSAFTETLQEPQKLTARLTEIQQKPEQVFQDLAVKGENMEQDIRNFVETYFCSKTTRLKYPKYIDSSSGQCFNQPYDIKGVNLHGFVIEGSTTKLQELCDKYLNEPANGEIEYRPVSKYVILSFNIIESLSSINPPYRDRGTIDEKEAMFWVLTMAGKRNGSLFVPERLAWFIPHLYIDSSPALISGREIYGFSKQMAVPEIPPSDREPDLFTLETLIFKEFIPDTPSENARLLEVKRIERGDSHPAIKTYETLEEVFKETIGLLFDRDGTIEIPGWQFSINLLSYILGRIVPMVGLKQFRDVKDSRRACYQAIVEAPMQLTKFHRGKLYGFDNFGDRYLLKIKKCASDPLVEEMGLSTINSPEEDLYYVPIKVALFLNFDFTLKNGTAVWEAGRASK